MFYSNENTLGDWFIEYVKDIYCNHVICNNYGRYN